MPSLLDAFNMRGGGKKSESSLKIIKKFYGVQDFSDEKWGCGKIAIIRMNA